MKTSPIPAPILTAVQGLLSPYVAGLAPSTLVAALKAFDPGKVKAAERDAAPPRMLSLIEAAQSLAVSRDTVRRMVKDGRLAGHKVGQQWRVPLAAVKALAETEEA